MRFAASRLAPQPRSLVRAFRHQPRKRLPRQPFRLGAAAATAAAAEAVDDPGVDAS